MRFATDPLHCENHTTCSESFQSKAYKDLNPLNKEACEQFNSILRSVQQSVTYMNFETYMSAMKVFIAFHNMEGIELNKYKWKSKCYNLHEAIICMYYNLQEVMQGFYVGYNLQYLLIHGCKP